MAIPPLIATKKVCQLRDWGVSNLEVNKTLYIAHMIFLGRYNAPLVSQHFEAWDYGPVLPIVYRRAKPFGSGPVQNVFHIFPDLEAGAEADTINEAVQAVKDKTPGELIAITHWNEGAWAKNYRPGAHGIVIPNEDILAEYRKRVAA
jgi:uncharacterized phage-associated protein